MYSSEFAIPGLDPISAARGWDQTAAVLSATCRFALVSSAVIPRNRSGETASAKPSVSG